MRTVTRESSLIRELKDGNQVIYMRDGTIKKTDRHRGIWTTINRKGVVRERNLRTGAVTDLPKRLHSNLKVDPETGASLNIREDGFLKVEYVNGNVLMVYADHTKIFIHKSENSNEDARVVSTFFEKEGYSTVKIT